MTANTANTTDTTCTILADMERILEDLTEAYEVRTKALKEIISNLERKNSRLESSEVAVIKDTRNDNVLAVVILQEPYDPKKYHSLVSEVTSVDYKSLRTQLVGSTTLERLTQLRNIREKDSQ